MEFIVNSYIIQEWTDERLKRENHHVIMLQEATDVWTPDVYCLNCRKSALDEKGTRVLLRIDVDGNIYYSQPGLLNAACNFDFYTFPFDVQRCKMQFASYSNNNSFVDYKLKKATFLEKKDLEQFKIDNEIKALTRVAEYLSGNYTIIELELKFTRQIGFYLIRLYIPTSVLVSLSWITFYVSPSDIETRLTIGITLILSMIFLLGYSDTSLPKVSYIKAIDWFLIMALLIIVLTVIETVVVYWYICKKEKQQEQRRRSSIFSKLSGSNHFDISKECSPPDEDDDMKAIYGSKENTRNRKCAMKHKLLCVDEYDRKKPLKFDCSMSPFIGSEVNDDDNDDDDFRNRVANFEIVARLVFPLVFFVFAIIYGIHYSRYLHE
ncbi:glycine receptor subunit alphaZ1-like isoform X2 [Hydractinia symbiolongicarpus]|uniref:glycine receptor subunit alphaZ1-like isoform X2 n=1 Tax=Hydractinia symbiolongicarpus TaxID=13093 RepID=UPI00254FFD0C|nr:glycine receptor subunit alphaZ1-like isoform X2 [Hydractinia symbiolongicarpus]